MMELEVLPLEEVNQRAIKILFREMGVADAMRFLNQFDLGHGDYTKERDQWLGDLSFDQIISEIEEKRN